MNQQILIQRRIDRQLVPATFTDAKGAAAMRMIIVCVIVASLSLLFLLPARGEKKAQPAFEALDAQVKEQWGGWSGSKSGLSELFQEERVRLGDDFTGELCRWAGTDVSKHYWASLFLWVPDYLHGQKAMPELALLLALEGVSLAGEDKAEQVRLRVVAAVLAARLGLLALAGEQKGAVERLRQDKKLVGVMPALGRAESELYADIRATTRGE